MSWPYRVEDWNFALQLGHGFVLQCASVVIGTAVWWPYGETHASAGMIIVAKAAQGRGYGAQLMDSLLASAHPRSIVLTLDGPRHGALPAPRLRPDRGHPPASGNSQGTQ